MTSFIRAGRRAVPALAAGVAASLALGGCSEDSIPLTIRNLDRPSTIAFGCYGVHEPGDDARPLPSRACEEPSDDGESPPRLFGFLLQDSRGTVAVIDAETQTVLDSDPLTPGKNAIPIGTLPVGLVADEAGCFMVSASAASCDLSALDVTSALDLQAAARIVQIPINGAAGRMRAKPRALVAGPQLGPEGATCGPEPSGTLYVAYPACHLVAAVDAESGDILGGIQFDADGNGVAVDGSVTCSDECGDGSVTGSIAFGGPDAGVVDAGVPDAGVPPDAGPPSVDGDLLRPVALHYEDGRIYVGSENSPKITVIELDEAGVPASSTSIQLEGEVGVTALSLSPEVQNGGAGGVDTTEETLRSRFLYAVATDRTVRVVKVDLDASLRECETQVDPRSLRTPDGEPFAEVDVLPCFPLGDPRFPRRSGALSPGIQLPGDQVPLDVEFAVVTPPAEQPLDGEPSPYVMAGTFAYVTGSQGNVFIVNVDDNVYPDFEDPDNPAAVSLALALPHQIRDRGNRRGQVAASCGAPSTDGNELGPRVDTSPGIGFSPSVVAPEKVGILPSIRQVGCTADPNVPASELSFLADPEDREAAFPDWRAVLTETWSVAWEGPLSRDNFATSVDGPPIRSGVMSVATDEYDVQLADPSGSFCQLGVEPFDEVRLLGCDPTIGDGHCGLGETCYVHPDTPVEVTTGICLPKDRAESLAALCRDFSISNRRYSAVDIQAGSIGLVPRRRVLRSSPLDGCDSADQCEQMARIEESLADPDHPTRLDPLPASGFDWACTQDPTRPPGPDRCLMTCESSRDCQPGDTCLAGFCNEGPPPWPECVEAVQRYQVRATDAFVVIGNVSGYLHNWVKGVGADPESGDPTEPCVLKEDPDPLSVGRIPLRPPLCDDPSAPNPCVTEELTDTRLVTPYDVEGDQCVADAPEVMTTNMVHAIRFQNPSFRFHLVNTEVQPDAECIGDGANAEVGPFTPVHRGFEIGISVVGGFIPMSVQFSLNPTFPVRVKRGPDGRVWVVDQGDGSGALGKVYTFLPSPVNSLFSSVIIQ